MNNKGFTLIELLAVIAILCIISTIAVPSIASSIERTNDKQDVINNEFVITSMKLYLSDNKKLREGFYGGTCYISVDKLIPKYLDGDRIKDSSLYVGFYVDNKIGIYNRANYSSYHECN